MGKKKKNKDSMIYHCKSCKSNMMYWGTSMMEETYHCSECGMFLLVCYDERGIPFYEWDDSECAYYQEEPGEPITEEEMASLEDGFDLQIKSYDPPKNPTCSTCLKECTGNVYTISMNCSTGPLFTFSRKRVLCEECFETLKGIL